MDTWQAAVLIINFIMALSLNSLMYYFVYRNRSLQTPFNISLLNVCSADMLVSVNMLFSTISTYTKKTMLMKKVFCDVSGFITLLSFVASVMGLAAVSFNRYLLICRWKAYRNLFTKLGTTIYIVGAWVFSLAISVPPLLGWGSFRFHSGKSICFVDWNANIYYMIFMVAICFCGPLFITLLSLYLILRTKRKAKHQLKRDASKSSKICVRRCLEQRRRTAKEERKITISILIIAVVFMIAWGPFVVIMFLETIGKQTVPVWIDFGTFLLGCISSTANPMVYMTLNVNYRNEVIRLLGNCGFQRYRQNENRTKTTSADLPRSLHHLQASSDIKKEARLRVLIPEGSSSLDVIHH